MMVRAAALAILLSTSNAQAALPELAGRVAAERPSGCAEYTYFAFRLYRAELWTDASLPPGNRFALSLLYWRDFNSDTLIKSSISEMMRISGSTAASEFDAARQELQTAMRSVRKGDRITALQSAPGRIEFFHNSNATGALTHHAELFLSIWLGPETRFPKRRTQLLSERCDD